MTKLKSKQSPGVISPRMTDSCSIDATQVDCSPHYALLTESSTIPAASSRERGRRTADRLENHGSGMLGTQMQRQGESVA